MSKLELNENKEKEDYKTTLYFARKINEFRIESI